MVIDYFVFSMEVFQFSKFYENEAKRDKRSFKKGLTVTFKKGFTVTFKVKN